MKSKEWPNFTTTLERYNDALEAYEQSKLDNIVVEWELQEARLELAQANLKYRLVKSDRWNQ